MTASIGGISSDSSVGAEPKSIMVTGFYGAPEALVRVQGADLVASDVNFSVIAICPPVP